MAATIIAALPLSAVDNELTPEERDAGWILLFDGRTLDGWTTNSGQPSRTPVQDGALNPHGCGGYMLIHQQEWSDFELVLDFRISRGCNSGVFFRTYPLEPRPGKDVGFNGLEIAIDDTMGDGYLDTGAIYDLVRPRRNAMRPAGEWNQLRLLCRDNLIEVEVNGELVSSMDLDEWTEPNRRPDGTPHRFDVAYKEHPQLHRPARPRRGLRVQEHQAAAACSGAVGAPSALGRPQLAESAAPQRRDRSCIAPAFPKVPLRCTGRSSVGAGTLHGTLALLGLERDLAACAN